MRFHSKIHYYIRLLQVTLPSKRFFNAAQAMISYQFSKKGKLLKWKHFPVFISLEPSNVCNLHCPECPVGIRTERVKPINIDLDLSEKLINSLSDTLTHIIFYFQGEPFMNPKFLKLVKYAREKNILTSTSTNAQLIESERARQIVESGLDRLIISLDGATQEVYEKYRVGGTLEKALQAVSDIVEWKKKLRKPHPFIEIQFIVMKHNEHQIHDVKTLVKKIKADKLTLKSAQIYDFENGNDFIPITDKYSRYKLSDDGKYRLKSSLKNRCKRLWIGAVVNSKGEVLPCCFDKDGKHTFGNLNNTDFKEIWTGKSRENFRKNILMDRKQFEMCRNCTEK